MKDEPAVVKELRNEEKNGNLNTFFCSKQHGLDRRNNQSDHSLFDYKDYDLYKNTFELSPFGIVIVDKRGTILSVNKAGADFVGYSADELIGKNFSKMNFFKLKSIPKYLKFFTDVLKGEEIKPFQVEVNDKNGKKIIVEVRLALLKKNGKIMGVQGITRDITEEKRIKKNLEELIKKKDVFINQLSHDLKNPIGPIVNLLPLVIEETKDPEVLEMLDVINRNARYMKDLIKDILSMAKLDSIDLLALKKLDKDYKEFMLEKVNLFDLVNDVIKENCFYLKHFQKMKKEDKFEIENYIPSDVFVFIDKLKIIEIFNNLISNSFKYNEKEMCKIIIDLIKRKEFVEICLKDNGVGLSPNELPLIFDDFYKVDKSRHDMSSSGLGLSICKRIIEKHGGRIWAESDGYGRGMTMHFTLPTKEL